MLYVVLRNEPKRRKLTLLQNKILKSQKPLNFSETDKYMVI